MWSVQERSAARKGRPLAQQIRLHDAYWRNKRAQAARPWIKDLRLTNTPPATWPFGRSWPRAEARWSRYIVAAHKFAAEHARGQSHGHVCPLADTYGGPVDGRHADDEAPCYGAVVVPCLRGAKQAYWDTADCGRVLPAKTAAGGGR
jgi:hypothetical protein